MSADDPQWRDLAQAAARAFDLVPGEPAAGSGTGSPAGPGAGAAAGSGTGSGGRELVSRLATDPDTVERDLMKLVLTLVELVRQLMERTALHRVDHGDLSEDQEERIGMTLMVLHDRMTDLCERYGLSMDDLNLDLGPLGSLLPRE